MRKEEKVIRVPKVFYEVLIGHQKSIQKIWNSEARFRDACLVATEKLRQYKLNLTAESIRKIIDKVLREEKDVYK